MSLSLNAVVTMGCDSLLFNFRLVSQGIVCLVFFRGLGIMLELCVDERKPESTCGLQDKT